MGDNIRRHSVRLFRLFALTTAATAMLGGLATAQSADSIGSFHVPPGERAGDHWTPDALSAAKPAPLLSVDPDAVRAASGPTDRSGAPAAPGATPAMDVAFVIDSFHVPPGERSGDHWTPEAISAAQAAPMPMLDPGAARAAGAFNRSGDFGAPGSTPAMTIAPR